MQEYYTKKEVAALLRVERRTIERWMAAGRLPFLRIGKRAIRISRHDLAMFVAENRVSSPRQEQ
jgi:excisionase family DNA binding protein